jgi:hypothetical protein
MRTRNGPVVAEALEIQMKKKVLIFGGIAAATLLVGGWALAQSAGHGPGGFSAGGMMGCEATWAKECTAKWGKACAGK